MLCGVQRCQCKICCQDALDKLTVNALIAHVVACSATVAVINPPDTASTRPKSSDVVAVLWSATAAASAGGCSKKSKRQEKLRLRDKARQQGLADRDSWVGESTGPARRKCPRFEGGCPEG